MSKHVRGMHIASAFAASLLAIAALSPCVEAGQAYNVAVEAMIEDIGSQMLLASVLSGGLVTVSDGMATVNPSGDSYSFSFTAGSLSVTDSAVLTPDGIAPGTGTWAITSNLLTTASATVSYDSTSTNYNMTLDDTFPTKYLPGIGLVNDFHFQTIVRQFPAFWRSDDTGFYTYNGKIVSGLVKSTDIQTIPFGRWQLLIYGASNATITGDTSTGAFIGTANAVPEPSSIVLIGIGLSLVPAFRWSPKKARSRPGSKSGAVSCVVSVPNS